MSYSGIATIVDQLTGRSRIPESAAPVTRSSMLEPKRAPKPKDAPTLRPLPREKLLAVLDHEYRSMWSLSILARISNRTAPRHLEQLVEEGLAEARDVRFGRGMKREYRRAR